MCIPKVECLGYTVGNWIYEDFHGSKFMLITLCTVPSNYNLTPRAPEPQYLLRVPANSCCVIPWKLQAERH